MRTKWLNILVIVLLFAAFAACAHNSASPDMPKALAYNSSRINSPWGVLALVLPEEVPPDMFWTPMAVPEVLALSEDKGLIVDADESGNDYGLVIDRAIPRIYGLIKIDSDYNISHWIYKNGVPVKCDPVKFFDHMGLKPQRGGLDALPPMRKDHEI